MNVDRIGQYCMAFPGATENLQWGDDLCFKIGGEIFATLALTALPQKLCFKGPPEIFAELIERQDIHPALYVGRYKWVILDRLDALSTRELEDFIRQSYEMVAANASKPTRKSKTGKPVKPASRARKTKRSRS